MEFPAAFLSHTFMDTQRKWSTTEQEAYGVYYTVTKWNYYLQGAEVITQNNQKPLVKFLKGKNTNNKINRWGLELTTCNIIFGWMLGAWNKAADCLYRLVELPHDRQATVQMLSATNHDELAFHTRSRTAQSNMTEHLTPHPTTDTTTPDITKSWTHQIPCQNHLPMINDKHYYRCREWIHIVSTSLNAYQTEKHQNMKLISFYTAKDYCKKMSQIQTRNSWLLSYQNHWNTQWS